MQGRPLGRSSVNGAALYRDLESRSRPRFASAGQPKELCLRGLFVTSSAWSGKAAPH